jgi:uncharacterized protein YndB with AHSA1/START domain
MHTVELTRTLPVSLERAWAAWTDPVELARWWWPHLADTTYDWRPEVGATYAIDSPTAGIGATGVFTEVDPPRRMSLTWTWHSDDPGEAPEDLVQVGFEPVDGGTLVTVRHSSPAEILAEGGLRQGWSDVLDRLVDLRP